MRPAVRRRLRRALPPLPPLDRRARWALASIVAAGALARVVWAITQATEPEELRDPVLYLLLGDQVANGEGYSYPGDAGGVTAYYPPGYPLVLGFLIRLVGPLPGDLAAFDVALWANVVLSVATIPLVFALGRRLTGTGLPSLGRSAGGEPPSGGGPVRAGGVGVGLVAAAAFAFWPNLVFHSGVVLTETLFLFLFALLFLVALATPEVARHPGTRRLVAVGVLFGVAGLVRPVSLVIGPLFLALWWPDGVRRAVRNTAVVAMGTVAVIVPWTVRNMVQMDAPVVLSTNFGDNFCIGNNPEATGAYGLPEYCFEGLDAGERPEFETHRQSETLDRGLTWLGEHPLDALALVPDRLSATLNRDDDGLVAAGDYGAHLVLSPGNTDRAADLADGYYFTLAALAVAGLVLAGRQGAWGDRRWRLFVLSAPVGLLSPMLTFGDARFKMPIYPVLAVCAAIAVVTLARRLPSSRRQGADVRGGTDLPGRDGSAVVAVSGDATEEPVTATTD